MTQPRSYVLGHLPAGPRGAPFEEHDGPRGRLAEIGLDVRDDAETPRCLETPHHHGQRLCIARLPPPQLTHRARVRRIAGQMVAAESLDRDDLTAAESGDGPLERVGHAQHPAAGVQQGESRAAGRTRGWLRVEAAIPRVLVLLTTGGA